MRNSVFLFILLLASGMARAQQNNMTGTQTYTYVPESSLNIEEQEDGRIGVSVERGKNLVFTYEFKKKDDPAIADDEYVMRILFEIPMGQTSFRYDAKDIKVVLMKGCFCTDRGYHRILTGYVTGEKTCKGWKISWHLETKTIPDSAVNNFISDTKAAKFIRPKPVTIK